MGFTWRRETGLRGRTTGATGSRIVCAALCSCNLASYPGDGVTVGGAALAGAIDIQLPRAATAAITQLAQNRFISFLRRSRGECALTANAKFVFQRRHFKSKYTPQGQVYVTERLYGRICSGVSPGEPLPAASALLISATIRRDNGTCSPCRSAIPVMTPCR